MLYSAELSPFLHTVPDKYIPMLLLYFFCRLHHPESVSFPAGQRSQNPEVPQKPETPQESETPQAAEPVQQVTQPEKESQSVTAAVEPKSENVVQQAPATGDTAGVAMFAVIMAAAGFAAVVTNSRVRKER